MAIYTIGYGNRTPEDFRQLLKTFEVTKLVDVRAYPYSPHEPSYNQETLPILLSSENIDYAFMGHQLGGRPRSRRYYRNGHVSYTALATAPFFLAGIQQLVRDDQNNGIIAIMCSELRPEHCHRSKLIGVALAERGVEVYHIDERGRLVAQKDVLDRLNLQYSLFEVGEIGGGHSMSRKQYLDKLRSHE